MVPNKNTLKMILLMLNELFLLIKQQFFLTNVDLFSKVLKIFVSNMIYYS